MKFAQFKEYLDESVKLGVKEYYFTGGEPFINPDIMQILKATLGAGPATVLTNATRLSQEKVARLAQIRGESKYSLEIRVSIDGFSPATNDPIRGEGTFDAAMAGVKLLAAHGFLPIITSMRSWPIENDEEFLMEFKRHLRAIGYDRPRMKLLPSLKIGEEASRDRGYEKFDWVTEEMMVGYDVKQLLCHNSRIVSDRGVHVCPVLVDQPRAQLGITLQDSLTGFRLDHQACSTCYKFGALCSNVGSQAVESMKTHATAQRVDSPVAVIAAESAA